MRSDIFSHLTFSLLDVHPRVNFIMFFFFNIAFCFLLLCLSWMASYNRICGYCWCVIVVIVVLSQVGVQRRLSHLQTVLLSRCLRVFVFFCFLVWGWRSGGPAFATLFFNLVFLLSFSSGSYIQLISCPIPFPIPLLCGNSDNWALSYKRINQLTEKETVMLLINMLHQ